MLLMIIVFFSLKKTKANVLYVYIPRENAENSVPNAIKCSQKV